MNKDNIYFENIDYFTNTLKKMHCAGSPCTGHIPWTTFIQSLCVIEKKNSMHSEIALI